MADQPDYKSLQAAAAARMADVLARREKARASRAAALAVHHAPILLRAELAPVPGAAATPATPPAPPALAASGTAGYLLAVGDSWFDYPLHDILTKLEDNFGYNVESSAHHGDPIEAMVSRNGQFDKLSRCMDKVLAHGVKPLAVLVSGGGDDIAGAEFGMLINNIDLASPGLNEQVIAGVIDGRVATAYRMMFLQINSLCRQQLGQTVPILTHGYDYPVPDGRGFLGGWGPLPGPWLKPGFDEKLYDQIADTTAMMKTLIDRFNTMLAALVKEPGFENVVYIDLRGTLSNALADDAWKQTWANELHPTESGFAAIAQKFHAVLP